MVYEIKLDAYRALAINAHGKLSLYSIKRKAFNRQYQHVFDALRDLPQNTVVDGEIVALDDSGCPNFTRGRGTEARDLNPAMPKS